MENRNELKQYTTTVPQEYPLFGALSALKENQKFTWVNSVSSHKTKKYCMDAEAETELNEAKHWLNETS